ncbi:MAG: hypothetical protein JSV52_01895 [Candidatus Zixiibacteriota bacterium]|nr:MAG: hypothetical protein JSV52_01895 [candidate division Zixibacteria bacterium]
MHRSVIMTIILLLLALPCLAAQPNNGTSQTVESVSAEVASFYNWESPPGEAYLAPRVELPYKVTTYVGQECVMPHNFMQLSAPVVRFAWDYDSDGWLDEIWDTWDPAVHVFGSPGKRDATLYAFDTYGNYGKATITVTVMSGTGENKIEVVKAADSFRQHPKKSRPADLAVAPDPEERYFLLINDNDCGLYYTIQRAYHRLVDTFGYHDANIVVVTNCTEHPDDTVFIDYSTSEMDQAFNYLIDRMTYNDDLHILVSAHGSGCFDSSIAWYGDIDKGPGLYARPFYLNFVGLVFTEDDDPEFIDDPDLFCTEDEFPVAIPQWWNNGYRTSMVGMNQWMADWEPEYCRRRMAVSHFNKVKFYTSKQPKSDDDEFIEIFVQYLKGDTNHNCKIEPELGEVWDYDGDGNPPIDTTEHGYVYDDQDWGDLGLLDNGTRSGFFLPSIAVFDAGLDDIPDVCFTYPEPPSQPIVHGTDWDNDGLVIGLDVNRDGDWLDSAGISENITVPDNYWGDFLDALEYRYVTGVYTNCFSGGVIDDMSRANVLVATATTAGTVAWGSTFTSYFSQALTGGISNRDFDPGEDRLVTFLDVYNYLDSLDLSNLEGRVRLDDNGDRVGHLFPLPDGGDGALAAELTWGTLPPPKPPVGPPVLVWPLQDDWTYDTKPTLIWSDTAAADSFFVQWGNEDFSVGGSATTTDTFFTFGSYVNPLPYHDLYWHVRSYKEGLTNGPYCDSVSFDVLIDYDCCIGMRGNLDGDPYDSVTMADADFLVEFLWQGGPLPDCIPEGNVDGSPGNEIPDIMDLMYLQAYLTSGGPPPAQCAGYLCGDADGSDQIDAADAVFLSDYLYHGGPPPEPMDAGDMDCIPGVDEGDLDWIVAYLWQGGPAPCDCE